MLKILVYDNSSNSDRYSLMNILNNAYVHRTLPISKLIEYRDLQNLSEEYTSKISNFNLFIMFLKKDDKDCKKVLDEVRKYKNIFFMFVVEKDVDISIFITPNIKTSSIIYSPIDIHLLHTRLVSLYKEMITISEMNSYFKVKNSNDYIIVNTKDILYFESIEKKILLKTNNKEYLFYSNFCSVLEQLPKHFIRCHKGFVVNTTKIFEMQFSKMKIFLLNGDELPISRTYKDELKFLLKS